MKPAEIERQSFRIIDTEAGEHGFDELSWPVVRRIIHTSAHYDYLRNIRISTGAIQAGVQAIQRGGR